MTKHLHRVMAQSLDSLATNRRVRVSSPWHDKTFLQSEESRQLVTSSGRTRTLLDKLHNVLNLPWGAMLIIKTNIPLACECQMTSKSQTSNNIKQHW